jgi:hypothetical protein
VDNDSFLGFSATDWTGIMALLTGGLLVTAFVAALYAARQVKLARQHGEEARTAEWEASRPYVMVTIEPGLTGPPLFDLLVKNIGRRPAVDVSITLDPPPMRASEPAGYELAKLKMLTEPVAMIAPGQEMRTHYDSSRERLNRDDLPSFHRVSLTYQDTSGHQYSETAVLDLDAMKGVLFTSVKTVHDIGKSLAAIQKTLGSASILGRPGFVEVAVESREERQERLARERSETRERLKRMVPPNRPDLAAALGPEPGDESDVTADGNPAQDG